MTDLDTISVSSRNSAQVGMSFVESVGSGVVESKDDVTLDAVGVVDEEVGDGGTVRNEVGSDTLGRDGYN